MAGVWLDSDEPFLQLLADLMELAHRGEANAAVLSEIRQLADRYGLSSLSRRRLQWEVDQSAPSEPDAPVEDGARWLRAVSD